MKFFAKCVVIYIGLTILLMIGIEFILDKEIPFAGNFLLSAFFGLLLTILYGWIDDVIIHQRQPELE